MLLSVLVPTKNKPDTLLPLIEGFVSWSQGSLEKVELVIVDNSDSVNQLVSTLCYVNVRYIWSSESLDMLQNFDSSICEANGEYSIIIGDDDTVLPSVLDVTMDIARLNIDSAMSIAGVFYWPGVNSYWVPNNVRGYYENTKRLNDSAVCDVVDGLRRVLRSGGCGYKRDLPSAYHGVVKTEILRGLIKKYGTAFPGPSPDISNAVLLALSSVSCRFYDSFVVSGASIGSASAEGANHAHHGLLSERLSYVKRGVFEWPSTVPAFFCGPTMWSVSVLHTLNSAGATDYVKALDHSMLHGCCLAFHPRYSGVILRSLFKHQSGTVLRFPFAVLKFLWQRAREYMLNYIMHSPNLSRFSTGYVIMGVRDTAVLVAMDEVNNEIS